MAGARRPAAINTGAGAAAPPPPPPPPAAQFVRELGSGASGVVSLVVFQNRLCACKQVRGLVASPAEVCECVNEFSLMGALRHPNIVRIIRADYAHGHLALLMEYVAGSSLADRYARAGRVPERVLGRIAWLCLEALAYLRSKHILHRDLKPSNILISDAGDVKVCDFGLAARLAASSDERSTGAGSVKYMSLERLQARPYAFPADVWSLGMLLYEGAAGRYPLCDAPIDVWGLQQKLEQGLDFDVAGYSDAFVAFLRHCLARAPDDRLAVETRRRSWAAAYENDGQDDLMAWIRETNRPA
jgi:serine/threonine protein kinase